MQQDNNQTDDYWMSVSDLMAGLMLLFLLIVLVKIKTISKNPDELLKLEKDKVKKYQNLFNQKTKENNTLSRQVKQYEDLIDKKTKAYDNLLKRTNEKTKEFNNLSARTRQYENLVDDFIISNQKLYEDLKNEFKHDLPKWGAILDRDTLSIVFYAPDVLFKKGSSTLTERYKNILQDFFPRYLRVLRNHTNIIEKVRIEGHTSSEYKGAINYKDAYFKNMKLSQDRTRAVLEYSMNLPKIEFYWQWAKQHITANGFSSSKLFLNPDKTEDKDKSRRVEFRIFTTGIKVLNSIQGINKD